VFYWSCRDFPLQANTEAQNKKRSRVADRMLKACGLLCLLGSSCALTHIYLRGYGSSFPARAGGIVGYLVSGGLTRIFNPRGSLLLLLTGFFCSVTLTTGFSWLALIDVLGAWVCRGMQHCWRLLLQKLAALLTTSHKKTKASVGKMLRWDDKPKTIAPDFTVNKAAKTAFAPVSGLLQTARQAVSELTTTAEKMPTISAVVERKKEKLESSVVLKPGTLPPLSLLNPPLPLAEKPFSQIRFDELSQLVEQRLLDFGVEVKVTAVHPGPVITRFELELAPGIKVSKITGLAKDIARSLSVASVRVVEVIPGKSVIGLEIANENREIVSLREILGSSQYAQVTSPVSLALGKDIAGVPIIVDLAKMPHLLVAGTTGSGKSVSLNAMLLSMLYKATPAELRFILIDPKMLELSIYDGIPHLLTPVITDMKDATNALRWCVIEMDKRYRLMASLGVRNLAGYNLKIKEAIKQGNPIPPPAFLAQNQAVPTDLETLPLIVVVADELADMMMVVGKKVEELVVRLAQKARAAGIHLVLATQRPSVDVITGLIKANVPTRIAFQVSSRIDSRTILDQQGAEQLLGHGDMLYLPAGAGIPARVHGAYVSDEEVHRVVAAWQTYGKPEYLTEVTDDSVEESTAAETLSGEADPLYDQAVRIVTESRRASISLIQRRLRIGYNRAARLMEDMEAAGLVSTMDSSGSREVLAAAPM
jgi:S-DNA-T family DNA segregation ATPase FtsK/SpoIIIE